MTTASKTIVELEAESKAACVAVENANARLDAIDKLMAALSIVSDAGDLSALTPADLAHVDVDSATKAWNRLWTVRKNLVAEIDRLEDVYSLACAALNDAPEEAA
jgi:hypothetical protein